MRCKTLIPVACDVSMQTKASEKRVKRWMHRCGYIWEWNHLTVLLLSTSTSFSHSLLTSLSPSLLSVNPLVQTCSTPFPLLSYHILTFNESSSGVLSVSRSLAPCQIHQWKLPHLHHITTSHCNIIITGNSNTSASNHHISCYNSLS